MQNKDNLINELAKLGVTYREPQDGDVILDDHPSTIFYIDKGKDLPARQIVDAVFDENGYILLQWEFEPFRSIRGGKLLRVSYRAKPADKFDIEIKLADTLLLVEALLMRRKNDLEKYRQVREQYILQLKFKLEGKGIEGFDGFMESLITWIDNRITDCEEEIASLGNALEDKHDL